MENTRLIKDNSLEILDFNEKDDLVFKQLICNSIEKLNYYLDHYLKKLD